jgi:glucosamine--fructose-6-phosphate aminotransferase (isomerizing)
VYLEDGEMAIIRLHKSMKVRNIKDDSLVDPYIQELQMNLEHRKKVTTTLC